MSFHFSKGLPNTQTTNTPYEFPLDQSNWVALHNVTTDSDFPGPSMLKRAQVQAYKGFDFLKTAAHYS